MHNPDVPLVSQTPVVNRVTTIDKIYRLDGADLIVDAVYDNESPAQGYGGEIIHRLLPGISNSGGFRIASRAAKDSQSVLYVKIRAQFSK